LVTLERARARLRERLGANVALCKLLQAQHSVPRSGSGCLPAKAISAPARHYRGRARASGRPCRPGDHRGDE
jgi:hypothetical protein